MCLLSLTLVSKLADWRLCCLAVRTPALNSWTSATLKLSWDLQNRPLLRPLAQANKTIPWLLPLLLTWANQYSPNASTPNSALTPWAREEQKEQVINTMGGKPFLSPKRPSMQLWVRETIWQIWKRLYLHLIPESYFSCPPPPKQLCRSSKQPGSKQQSDSFAETTPGIKLVRAMQWEDDD